jgi:hypothetical protein
VASCHKGPTTGRNGGAEIVDLNPQGGEACRSRLCQERFEQPAAGVVGALAPDDERELEAAE